MAMDTKLFVRKQSGGMFQVLDRSSHTGDIWYVDSVNGSNNATTTGYGRNPDSPLASLAYLITNAATLGLSAGDEVILMPGHNEGIGDAQITIATVGLYIHGLVDSSNQRPRIDFDHANASIDIAANAVIMQHIDLIPSVPAVLIGVDVNTGAEDVILDDLYLMAGEDGAGADEFVQGIRLQSGNHGTQIQNCKIVNHDTCGGSTHAICIAAASNYVEVVGNMISGPWATAGMNEVAAGLEQVFVDNYIDVTGANANWNANSTFARWEGNIVGGIDAGDASTRASTLTTNYYVDSATGNAANSGLSWADAKATVEQGINLCTAGQNDVVHVAAGHTETVGGAASTDLDVIGLTVRGHGEGNERPTISFDTNTDTWEVNAASVTIENMIFVSAVADLASAIDVTAASDGFTIRNCEFRDGGAAVEMLIALDIEAAADNMLIEDCRFYTTVGGDCTHAIDFAGESVNSIIRRNIFVGEWDTAALGGATAAQTNISILNNDIFNADANAGLAIGMHANSTGQCNGNRCMGGLTSVNPISAVGMHQADNKAVTTIPGVDDGELGIRCVRASSTIAQTGVLSKFTIAGGRVAITAVLGEVDTANIGANASNLNLVYNPTAGITQAMCAVVAHASDTIGTLYGMTGNPADAMHKCGAICSSPLILDAGDIEEQCSGNNTGQIQWTVWWKPIDAGATLVAA